MRPRVLFADAYPAHVAGAQLTLGELATGLRDRFDVCVATVAVGAAADYWRSLGLAVHVVPYPEALQRWQGELVAAGGPSRWRTSVAALRHARAAAALLRAEEIDVLYCSNVRTVLTFGVGARLARVPSLWYVQQLQHRMGRSHSIAARIATRVASLSARTDSVFPHGLPANRSVVIPLGIDLERWSPRPQPPPGPPLRLAYVGQIAAEKGLDSLVQALAELRTRGVHATLRIIGAAADDHGRAEHSRLCGRIEALALQTDVEWFGHTDDVPGALAGSHLLVSGSRREGLPRSMMEAMALGLPVVATDVGAVRDLVIDGVTGFVVPPDDPRAMAEAVARSATDPTLLAAQGAAASERVRDNFDLARTVSLFAAELSAMARR